LSIRFRRETVIKTDILQSFKISLKIITIATTVKILMLVRHIIVVANVVLCPLKLTAKIIAIVPRKRTNMYNMIEFDQHVNLIPKMLVSKIGSD
jgi:hypothetical protein